MTPSNWGRFATMAAGIMTVLGLSSGVYAQESLEVRLQRLENQNEEIRKNAEVFQKQAEVLQKQNDVLIKLLNQGAPATAVSTPSAAALPADDVRNIVNNYLQEKEAKQKAAEAAIVAAPEAATKLALTFA